VNRRGPTKSVRNTARPSLTLRVRSPLASPRASREPLLERRRARVSRHRSLGGQYALQYRATRLPRLKAFEEHVEWPAECDVIRKAFALRTHGRQFRREPSPVDRLPRYRELGHSPSGSPPR
jgi:hypothetical protein